MNKYSNLNSGNSVEFSLNGMMNRVTLFILILLLSGISSVYAQDVITLRNGDEIKARVTEITPSEIKYKRFENLDGPTVTVSKSDVFAINYENGTREVINVVTSSAIFARAARYSENSFGIYANPGGFLGACSFGPTIGAEITRDFLIIDLCIGIPGIGIYPPGIYPANERNGGISLGVGLKYYKAKPNGGFYVGTVAGYYSINYTEYDATGILAMANVGYKFVAKSGLYYRTGIFLGTDWGNVVDNVGGMFDFAIGFKF